MAESVGLAEVVARHERELLEGWTAALRTDGALRSGRVREAELLSQCHTFLDRLRRALESGTAADGEAYAPLREFLSELSRERVLQGFTPTENATFVFSFKQPLFNVLNAVFADDSSRLGAQLWAATRLIDDLGLFTVERHQKVREEVIARQQQEISELSTPVVKLWDGIVALPLIGTLDSGRTQVVMENLLQSIVDQAAEIAIIDITGVPTVDTLVAQHLLKTIAAARLMGADCIISGIRPQIAQTMVHLGVELNVVSKSTLADAFALALRRTGRTVARARPAPDASGFAPA